MSAIPALILGSIGFVCDSGTHSESGRRNRRELGEYRKVWGSCGTLQLWRCLEFSVLDFQKSRGAFILGRP